MSIGATRFYLGVIDSAAFDNQSVGAADVDEWATKTPIHFDVSSHQSYLTDQEK